MFAARCAGVSLAVFVLVSFVCSLGVSGGWRLLLKLVKPGSARGAADLLFAIRVSPLVIASIVTLGVTLPSFLLLEPHGTDEAVGTIPVALATAFLTLVAWGIFQAMRAQRKTSRSIEQWMQGSIRIDSDVPVPVFRSNRRSPTLTVAGVCAPKVIVSEDAASVLTAAELRTALLHEIAHVSRYDNLKKLIFRVAWFPGVAPLEAAWAEQTELAADDAAVSSVTDALDLASALIKVSRLGYSVATPEISTALLHSSTALTMRIRRLFAWNNARDAKRAGLRWLYGIPAIAILFCMVVTYGTILSSMHDLTEWLVRWIA
jgi:beta-lactamase regulating signal transducer with metallopeptidase domain